MGYVHFPARYEVEIENTSIEGRSPVFCATIGGVNDEDQADVLASGKATTAAGAVSDAFRRLFSDESGGIVVDLAFYGAITLGLIALAAVVALLIGGIFVL